MQKKYRLWLPFVILLICAFVTAARADLTFYLVDNFESESYSKWFSFGNLDLNINKNPRTAKHDLVADSCGDFSLGISGAATDWYIGGIGLELGIDASSYSRIQLDIFGNGAKGKIKIELYDDDNGTQQIEQDENWQPLYDDKWAVEIPVLGKGFTRFSIPFTAFTDENPKVGDGIFNPTKKNGSGGLVRMQLIFVAAEKIGSIDIALDNVLLTY
ncbi:hypothetical protein ACFL52_01770 [Candidatus Margulisiibacteriota bacterium]